MVSRRTRRRFVVSALLSCIKVLMVLITTTSFIVYIVTLPDSSAYFTDSSVSCGVHYEYNPAPDGEDVEEETEVSGDIVATEPAQGEGHNYGSDTEGTGQHNANSEGNQTENAGAEDETDTTQGNEFSSLQEDAAIKESQAQVGENYEVNKYYSDSP